MELTSRFSWQGREIAWDRWGDGPALVFCHGTPFSSVLWHPFAAALAARFTVFVWDMPGYGASSKDPAHPVDFDAQSHAFGALLEHWEVARPHVVAHDFGGAVSLRTHLVREVAYASLMLVDPVAIPPIGSPFFQFVQTNPGLLERLPGYVHEAIVRAYVANASVGALAPDVLDELVRPWTGEEGQPAFYKQIADFDQGYLVENEERLPGLEIPLRIVWGERDAWIPVQMAHRLHELVPTSTLRLIPGSNHLVQHDAPVALMASIDEWLGEVSAATP